MYERLGKHPIPQVDKLFFKRLKVKFYKIYNSAFS